jgi:hypothetical protein
MDGILGRACIMAENIFDRIRDWFFALLDPGKGAPSSTPVKPAPPPPPGTAAECEARYGPFHQYQGAGTAFCGDTCLSMVGQIYRGWCGEPAGPCARTDITEYLDHLVGGRFPDIGHLLGGKPSTPGAGGSTPWGIQSALDHLGIPYTFDLTGTLAEAGQALAEGKIVVVSEGKFFDPMNGSWGHVMVLVGMDGDGLLFLDPATHRPAGQAQLHRIAKDEFLRNWWYPPFSPCWVIG